MRSLICWLGVGVGVGVGCSVVHGQPSAAVVGQHHGAGAHWPHRRQRHTASQAHSTSRLGQAWYVFFGVTDEEALRRRACQPSAGAYHECSANHRAQPTAMGLDAPTAHGVARLSFSITRPKRGRSSVAWGSAPKNAAIQGPRAISGPSLQRTAFARVQDHRPQVPNIKDVKILCVVFLIVCQRRAPGCIIEGERDSFKTRSQGAPRPSPPLTVRLHEKAPEPNSRSSPHLSTACGTPATPPTQFQPPVSRLPRFSSSVPLPFLGVGQGRGHPRPPSQPRAVATGRHGAARRAQLSRSGNGRCRCGKFVNTTSRSIGRRETPPKSQLHRLSWRYPGSPPKTLVRDEHPWQAFPAPPFSRSATACAVSSFA
ncbi:hypothetical protein BKA81DRAFT_381643 [Phyllosticta paracitricarpa]|uniref:Secreted protein n=1 Tax=Phyllosticta citricarpa TaxID=55181 RepID=A0ABR1LGW5_9PEZI